MSTFPSVLTTYPTRVNGQTIDASHLNDVQSGVVQLERTVGLEGSASTAGTIQYDLRSSASDGGGHVQSVNKGGTGQTAYTKGDVLIAQSSSVLTKLAISGTDGYALVSDSTTATGIKWGLPGNVPTIRVYATPSVLSSTISWTKPSNLSYIVVECVGGGGAGFNGSGSDDGSGGGGGYAKSIIPASSVQSSMLLYIGTGGALQGVGASGLAGGNTYFGASSLVMATGGGGGQTNIGGVGGIGSIGTLLFNGGNGTTVALGAVGGKTFFSPGGTMGNSGTAYGEGGVNAGAGNAGVILITEY